MSLKDKIAITALVFVFTQIPVSLPAEELKAAGAPYLFQGVVLGDNINIRSDSTVSAPVICKVEKGQALEVISQLYDWYKVRLPDNASSFIKKDFVTSANAGSAGEVTSDNVNIRLRPDSASVILGRANKGDLVEILEDNGSWYRIRPPQSSFGWIHKNFVGKSKNTPQAPVYKDITVEGVIKPKTFTRIATHKLIARAGKVYLLKADIESLNLFNNRKVKITGRLAGPAEQKYPVIEVEKIEALD